MKKFALSLVCLLFVVTCTTAQVICINCYQQNDSISSGVINLLKNGGFEAGTCNTTNIYYCPKSTYHNCDITDWQCTGGGSSTYAQIVTSATTWTQVVQGTYAVYFGNSFCNACDSILGDTTCLSDSSDCTLHQPKKGYPTNTNPSYGLDSGVSISQVVTGLTVGKVYVLEFWAGGEDGGYFIQQGLFAVDLGFGNMFLRNNGTNPGKMGTRFVIQFKATSTSHRIKFTNWGHICSTCTELVLDDARLYTQTQLASWVPHCKDSTKVDTTPIVNNPPPFDSIYYPNVFTPNADGHNDAFKIYCVGYKTLHCDIFNRWGQLVYQWDGLNGAWDGTIKGAKASDGVYYFIATAQKVSGVTTVKKGYLELLRTQ